MDKKFQKNFPSIAIKMNNYPLCYLDSGASSLKLKSATDKLVEYSDEFSCNIHRGVYHLSEQVTQKYESVRGVVSNFINAPTDRSIIFNSGTTIGINHIARLLVKSNKLLKGDEVLVSVMEHHANIVPWLYLENEIGIKVKTLSLSKEKTIDPQEVQRKITPQTKLLACTHLSNILGSINPIKEICQIARQNNVITVIDGAQAVPHIAVNLEELGCDFYCFSGHKVFAPTGVGVLYGRKELLDQLSPVIGGGDMVLSVSWDKIVEQKTPHQFEAGTPPIAQVISLQEALLYIKSIGWEEIQKKEEGLRNYALEQFKKLPYVHLVNKAPDIPLFTFTFDGVHPHDVGSFLDARGIAVRVGHHCAEPLLKELKIPSTIRASLSFYNDKQDIDRLIEALRETKEFFCEYK